MKVIKWDDKFVDEWRYDSTIDYDVYIEELKDNIINGVYTLLQHEEGTYTVVYTERTPRGKVLWIEFGHSTSLAGSRAIDDLLDFARSDNYDFVSTNCEKESLALWYEKCHSFFRTHYNMELKL